MSRFKIHKFLLVTSFILTVTFSGLILFINAYRTGWNGILLVLFLFIALAPNLTHIYVSYTLRKKYYPHKEVPRSFIVPFKIVSVFSWIVWAGLLIIIAGLVIHYFTTGPDNFNLHFLALPAFISYGALVCLMPFQLIVSSQLLSVIQKNHSKYLLESFY